MNKYVKHFIECYNEVYGEPDFSISENRHVISDELIKAIYDDYRGFEGITFSKLCLLLGETYYIDYGFQDSY